jgi:hypothetical protein
LTAHAARGRKQFGVKGMDRQCRAADRRNIREYQQTLEDIMIKAALKSMALSAICAAFLSAVTAGAALAGGEVKKLDPDCIKKCNDAVDACMAKHKKHNAHFNCDPHYTNCIEDCKF